MSGDAGPGTLLTRWTNFSLGSSKHPRSRFPLGERPPHPYSLILHDPANYFRSHRRQPAPTAPLQSPCSSPLCIRRGERQPCQTCLSLLLPAWRVKVMRRGTDEWLLLVIRLADLRLAHQSPAGDVQRFAGGMRRVA